MTRDQEWNPDGGVQGSGDGQRRPGMAAGPAWGTEGQESLQVQVSCRRPVAGLA